MFNYVAMSRARIYALIDAFERDIRTIVSRYVLAEMSEEDALGSNFSKANIRRLNDSAMGDQNSVLEYLDLREAYDLLNRHRNLIPYELASEVRLQTNEIDRVVPIRNRVMHARPIAPGDGDTCVSALSLFTSRWWLTTSRILRQLQADQNWEPTMSLSEDPSSVLHNLPLPDYDETGLIGRSKELSELHSLIKRGREPVLTVTGEGGIGKTAIALEIAYKVIDDPETEYDAVLWASLKYERLTGNGISEITNAVRDMSGVAAAIGESLDSNFAGSIDELAQALEGIKALLVIDNLETVGGEDFAQLYEALPATITYLVTSRVGIGQFERRYPLGALAERDGLTLFNDFVRTRRIEGLSKLTSETRREVVSRLRYSPLAIKWFTIAVDSGHDPIQLIRNQDELLDFCVRSVYDSLSREAHNILSTLSILGRALRVDELVVLLKQDIDCINKSVQELVRGALVRRESSANTGLHLKILLTETAQEFLSRRVRHDSALQNQVKERESEYLHAEERRATDIAARSLAPIVVRQRDSEDSPTCQVLRDALLASQRRDADAALRQISIARSMNPDFWEVDRVEGFVKAYAGDYSGATRCYERAYSLSSEEDRGVVAHFYAGHLARNVRDLSAAIMYAQEAHKLIQSAETAVPLGTFYIWAHRFPEGIELIAREVPNQTGRGRLISIGALADGYRRWAESSAVADRNPALQYARGRKGFDIAWGAINTGVSDSRLRDTATACAIESLKGLRSLPRGASPVKNREIDEWLLQLTECCVGLVQTKQWSRLLNESRVLSQTPGLPGSAGALLAELTELSDRTDAVDDGGSTEAGARLVGQVLSVNARFGFIQHIDYPKNIFFHENDLDPYLSFDDLIVGQAVRFSVLHSERGPRAMAIVAV